MRARFLLVGSFGAALATAFTAGCSPGGMTGDAQAPGDLAIADLAMPDLRPSGPDLLPLPTPTLASVDPTHGPTSGGTKITLRGTNFFPGTRVRIGDVLLDQPSVRSGEEIEVFSPPAAGRPGPRRIEVIGLDGQTAGLDNAFRYEIQTIAFGAAQAQPTGTQQPSPGVVADLDKDGKADVVVRRLFDMSNMMPDYGVSILAAQGGGRFAAPVKLAENAQPSSAAAGDFNGDGWPDLALAEGGANQVSVRLNDGKGALKAPSLIALAPMTVPVIALAGDLDGDGKADLLTVNRGSGSVSALLAGDGGAFKAPRDAKCSASRASAAVLGYFDAGRTLDACVADLFGASLSVFPNAGGGALGAESLVPAGMTTLHVTAGDVDGDGRDDLFAATGDKSGIRVLRNGAMGFGQPMTLADGITTVAPALADLDFDGKLDAAVLDVGNAGILIHRGNGDGSFKLVTRVPTVTQASWVALADVDGDGLLDLLCLSQMVAELQVYLNTSK